MNRRRRTRRTSRWDSVATLLVQMASRFGGKSHPGRARRMIGRDIEGSLFPSVSGRWQAGLLVGAVIALLAVVHVRVQIIEQGYLRAQAVERVDELMIERQRLKARVGALLNRDRLNAYATKLELAQPEHEISLRTIDRMDP